MEKKKLNVENKPKYFNKPHTQGDTKPPTRDDP